MRQRDIKKTIYFSEKECKQLQKNAKKLKLSQSEYLRSLIMNYTPKEVPDKKLMNEIINELKYFGKVFNEIARQANYYNYINAPAFKRAYEKFEKLQERMKKEFLD